MDLYLFRHAEAGLNLNKHIIGGRSPHHPLTADGELQARALGSVLRRIPAPTEVLVAPTVRTRRTAEIALQEADADYEIQDHPLISEIHLGEWEGQPREGRATREWYLRYVKEDICAPAGEMFAQVCERGRDFLRELEGRDGTVWAFTHAFFLRALVNQVMPVDTDPPNASVTHLRLVGDEWHVVSYASVDHLEYL